MKMKVHATFNGRLKNAIGIVYRIEDTFEIETSPLIDFDTALNSAIYKKYEHIMGLKWEIEDNCQLID